VYHERHPYPRQQPSSLQASRWGAVRAHRFCAGEMPASHSVMQRLCRDLLRCRSAQRNRLSEGIFVDETWVRQDCGYISIQKEPSVLLEHI
jgi:hypothetical protein